MNSGCTGLILRIVLAAGAVFLLLGVYAGLCLPAVADPIQIPSHTQQELEVIAETGDTILLVEARFVADAEGQLVQGVRLLLNNVLLTGDRIIGSQAIVKPKEIRLFSLPVPRYSTTDRTFAFLSDTDFTVDHEMINGCSPQLQLRVEKLVKPGKNIVRIINGAELPFEVKQVAMRSQAMPDDPLLPDAAWPFFAWNDAARLRYSAAIKQEILTPEVRAHLLAAIGIAEILREGGDHTRGLKYLQDALATTAQFDLGSEAAYRLAAARQQSGKWMTRDTEALVRAAVRGEDPWAQLTRAMLDVIDGKATSPARPIIRPVASRKTITVDGQLDEPCWAAATVYPIRHPMSTPDVPGRETSVRFAVVPEGIAVAFTGQLPKGHRWQTGILRDTPVWEDKCVEWFIAPDSQIPVYYELNASPLGAQFDARNRWWWNCHGEWNGDWQVASRMADTAFTVEYLVPWSTLGLPKRPKSGTVMVTTAIRFARAEVDGKTVSGFFSMTPHRAVDCHRMMDGALLVMP